MQLGSNFEIPVSGLADRQRDRLVLVGLVLVACVLTVRWLGAHTTPFKMTHWIFSYQEGLHARALVGSTTQLLLGDHWGSLQSITAMSWVTTALLVAVFVLVGFRYWRKKRSDTRLLQVAVLIACPGTIQYFAGDSGRLDQVGYLIVIAACCTLPRIHGAMQWILVSATSVVLCLIHEAFVIMLAPTLIATVLLLQSNGTDNRRAISQRLLRALLSLLPSIGVAAALVTVGRLDYDTQFLELGRRLSEIADFEVDALAITTHFRTLGQNALYTHRYLFEPSHASGLVTALVALLPSGIVAFFVALRPLQLMSGGRDKTDAKVLAYAVILCCLAPLALLLFGHDYGRWMAAAVTNLFLVGMIARSHGSADGEDSQNTRTRSLPRPAVIGVVLFSLAVGPVSAVAGPHSLQRLFEALLSG